MPEIDSETLELILDPSTRFVERRRAFDEAMKWAFGQGWDACQEETRVVLQGLGVDFDAPPKPAGMTVPDRQVEVEPEPERFWKMEDIPVIDGHATLPDGRYIESNAQVVRVPILRNR